MDSACAVSAMQALGHGARLDAYRALVRAGRAGLSIAEVQAALGDMPRSTLAHHLHKLVHAGLVTQEKRGATVVSRARFETMDALVAYLTEACCVDEARASGAPHLEVVPAGG